MTAPRSDSPRGRGLRMETFFALEWDVLAYQREGEACAHHPFGKLLLMRAAAIREDLYNFSPGEWKPAEPLGVKA